MNIKYNIFARSELVTEFLENSYISLIAGITRQLNMVSALKRKYKSKKPPFFLNALCIIQEEIIKITPSSI
ncbi:MAG: hypothetical protein OSW71_18190 [Proteobacteria bacterium]|nr:hypothetical protein [Pseudomonadota bacterium]